MRVTHVHDPILASAAPERPGGLHVTHVLETYGGVETWLVLLLDHWRDSGTRFSFVLAHDNDLADTLRARGHQVRVVPMSRSMGGAGGVLAVRRLRRAIDRLDPHVVHLHSSQAGLVGRLALRRSPRRVLVYTPHAYFYLGHQGMKRQAFLWAERILDRLRPSHVMATSPSEGNRAIDDIGVEPARVDVHLNAVDLPERLPVHRASAAGARLRVGVVGRLCAQKDYPTLLQAVALLRGEQDDRFDFHLVGVGHYEDDQRRLAEHLRDSGLTADDVHAHPWMQRAAVLEWMSTCDVAVLTSRFESFGYTLAEAQARGIPVIGTDVDGLRDVVAHGRSGLLVPPGSPEDLAVALRLLADDPVLRADLAAGALAVAAERFDILRLVRDLSSMYRRLVGVPAVLVPLPARRSAVTTVSVPAVAAGLLAPRL